MSGTADIVARPFGDEDVDFNDVESSTASISSSVLEYRAIQGRTFHSARHPTDYFTPNDGQQQQSVDLTHHYLTVLLDGKLYLAPIPEDVKNVIDIGTGTGIWAIDFADEHPEAQVIGTDLSPMQPTWIPPNMKFEVDDATVLPWTYTPDSFDFVHVRYLFGAISDWTALFKEAYRVLRPGTGWIQDCEIDVRFRSDDGTTEGVAAMEKWSELFELSGRKTGASFTVVADDLQRRSLEEAGFVDVQVRTFKVPVGGWPLDPKLAEVGRLVHATLENDLEGYTLLLWHNVLNWPAEEYRPFLADLRKALRNRKYHGYYVLRYAFGRKPEA
ncbi:mRNA 3'-end-processing protein yth1 [Echria macrotheca]|uniref:mRNA 3'-end-processing protein yth1 n=1 Tax=Echria macrotheca TaxID=438768 RepID=A0AAJ0F7T8_9PEZI|nr:mRNA 3'-end-processing protein yth1 [Echria macrotheca]